MARLAEGSLEERGPMGPTSRIEKLAPGFMAERRALAAKRAVPPLEPDEREKPDVFPEEPGEEYRDLPDAAGGYSYRQYADGRVKILYDPSGRADNVEFSDTFEGPGKAIAEEINAHFGGPITAAKEVIKEGNIPVRGTPMEGIEEANIGETPPLETRRQQAIKAAFGDVDIPKPPDYWKSVQSEVVPEGESEEQLARRRAVGRLGSHLGLRR